MPVKLAKPVPFAKMAGAGNDFILVKAVDLDLSPGPFARGVCDRRWGVGADGLLILAPSSRADFRLVYYNADGSKGEMCANGARCLARYAYLREGAPRCGRVETEAGVHTYTVIKDAEIHLGLPDVGRFKAVGTIDLAGQSAPLFTLNTGVPHLVVLLTGLDQIDVLTVGRTLRNQTRFQPHGTNVDFVEQQSNGSLAVRTYERGVEGETLSCGTGCVASALVGYDQFGLASPIRLVTRSGEILTVTFTSNARGYTNVGLEGSAYLICEGVLMGLPRTIE